MKKRLRLLLDMDGPMAAFDEAFFTACRTAGFQMDIDHPSKQIHRYSTDHIADRFTRNRARELVNQDGWFRNLPVTPGSQEGVEELLSADFDIWVCTKPLESNKTCRDEKAAWLAEHFPQLKNRLITAPDKSMIIGDILLDDAPKLEWLGRALWRPVIFTMPFNVTGSKWEDLPHWTWGDDPEQLIPYQDFESPYTSPGIEQFDC